MDKPPQKTLKQAAITLLAITLLILSTLPAHGPPQTEAYLSPQPPPTLYKPVISWSQQVLGNAGYATWSPDGSILSIGTTTPGPDYIFSYAPNGTLLWYYQTMGLLNALAWSPDGRILASASGSYLEAISPNGTQIWRSTYLGDGITSISWNPQGEMIAASSYWYDNGDHGKVYVYSANGTLLWQSNDFGGGATRTAWSPDGSLLVVGTGWFNGVNGSILAYSPNGTLLWNTDILGYSVDTLAWSPDGTMLLAMTDETDVYLYTPNGTLLWHNEYSEIRSIAWSPDSQLIAITFGSIEGGHLEVISNNGTTLWSTGQFDEALNTLAWSHDGTTLLVGTGWFDTTSRGTVIAYDTSGTQLWEAEGLKYVRSLAWSPDDSMIAVATLWDMGTGTLYMLSPTGAKLWAAGEIPGNLVKLAWSPDNTKLAVILAQNRLYMYDSDGTLLWEIDDLPDSPQDLAWSPDSQLIAISLGCCSTGILQVYHTDGTLAWETGDLGKTIGAIAWSPDGTLIAAGTHDGRLIVYQATGTTEWEISGLNDVRGLSWSPDSNLLAVATGWSSNLGMPLGNLIVYHQNGIMAWETGELNGSISMVAWNPEGTLLAAELSGSIAVYDAAGTQLWTDYQYWGAINTIAWSPDSTTLAVTASYGIYAYNPDGGQLWVWKPNDTTDIQAADWSPDSTTLVAATESYIYTVVQGETGWRGPYIGVGTGWRYSVNWNNQNTLIAVGAPAGILVYSLSTETPALLTLTGQPGTTLAITGPYDQDNYTIPETGALQLYSTPGQYTLNYSLPIPQPFLGDPALLNGTTQATTTKDNPTTLQLPLYQDILGRITVTAPDTAVINFTWPGGHTDYIRLENNTNITLWASPGQYNLSYYLIMNELTLGDTKQYRRGVIPVNISTGQTTQITLPKLIDVLGILNITGTPRTYLTITWPTGNTSTNIPDNGILTLWAAPGTYNITVYRNGPHTITATVDTGEVTTVNLEQGTVQQGLPPSGGNQTTPPGKTTTPQQNQTQGSTGAPPPGTNQTGNLSGGGGKGTPTAAIAAIAIIIIIAAIAILLRKR